MDKERISKRLIDFQKFQDERNTKYSEWLKNTITIATGFLAILVSLKTKKSDNLLQHNLYVTVISTIALGILSGIIVLFSDIIMMNAVLKLKKKQIRESLKEENYSNYPKFDYINRPKLFSFIEYVCYISFIISLISLICYAVVTDI